MANLLKGACLFINVALFGLSKSQKMKSKPIKFMLSFFSILTLKIRGCLRFLQTPVQAGTAVK